MANIRDVAARAGVSAATVSRILNGDKGFAVKEDTRDRVWQAINDLGYMPTQHKAKAKKQADAPAGEYAIGSVLNITVEGIGDPSFLSILQGIERGLKRHGQALTYFKVASGLDISAAISEIPPKLNGFIAMHNLLADDYQHLRNAADHLVGIDNGKEDMDDVGYDHYEVGTLAANHLLEQGYRSLGFVYGSESADGPDAFLQQSLMAFRHAVDSAGGTLRPEHVVMVPNWKQSICFDKTVEMLTSATPPRAIYYASDLMAVTAIGAVQSLGLSIPGDVALMGISNNAMTAFTTPPLTTIDLPLAAMGEVAADLLMARIGGSATPTQRILLPVRLIARASTLG